jgi:sn-glycerol 3-phosphate transport system ATP-binding protein
VEEAAELLQLCEYLDRKPRQLSGGQRQRVAMGRAIVRKPAVFLFDEPLSNLDAKLRVQMRLEIRKLQRRLGVTSVYVTHDQVEAMTLGDKLMVLNGGHVEQYGTPIDLYEKPASLFVADFIGSPSMNFLNAQVSEHKLILDNGAVLDTAFSDSGRAVTIGLRPEHMVQDDNGPIAVEPAAVEQLGANTLVHGVLKGTNSPIVASLPGIHSEKHLTSTLNFMIPAELLHFFDVDSGKRLT